LRAVFYYLDNMLSVMLLFFVLFGIYRRLWLRKHSRPVRFFREALLGVFAAFLIALAGQTILPSHGWAREPVWTGVSERIANGLSINLIPFHTIGAYLSRGNFFLSLINLGGNVVVFLPIGLMPPLLWKKWQRIWKAAGAGFLTSLSIETIQLFIGRSVDIDDVLLNTLGALLGYLLYRVLLRLFPAIKKLSI